EEVNGDLGGTDRKSRELLGHEVGLLAGLSQLKPNPPSAVPLASRRRESYHSWASIQDAGGLRLRRRGRAASPPRAPPPPGRAGPGRVPAAVRWVDRRRGPRD